MPDQREGVEERKGKMKRKRGKEREDKSQNVEK